MTALKTLKQIISAAIIGTTLTSNVSAQSIENLVADGVIISEGSKSKCLSSAKNVSNDTYRGQPIAFICSNHFEQISGASQGTIAITGICDSQRCIGLKEHTL